MLTHSQLLNRILRFAAPKQRSRLLWVLTGGLSVWICADALAADVDPSVDAVAVKDKQVYCIRGEQWDPTTNAVKLPFDIEVNTNATFTVGGGGERDLVEGQILRKDGWLLEPNGYLQPVFDHVAMRSGTVMLMRDGKSQPLTQTMTFPNNLTIAPDGSVVYPSGNRSRLADGQLFQLDGTSIASRDSVTLKNGRVTVLKEGALIPLTPAQIMGMNDGTRVQGDGQITKRDGTVFRLNEGQTILLEGAIARN